MFKFNYTQGILNFEVGTFEKCTSHKKKLFWNPLAEGYKMPSESEFYKACAQIEKCHTLICLLKILIYHLL